MAYLSTESGQIELYVSAFPKPGRKVQVSTGGGFAPAWRADTKELYYQSFDLKLMAVPFEASGTEPQLGRPAALFDLSDNAAFDVACVPVGAGVTAVQLAEPPHHAFANLPAGHLSLAELKKLALDLAGNALQLVQRDRPLVAGCPH